MGILIYWKFKSLVLPDRHEIEKCLRNLGSLPTKEKKYKGKAGESYLDLLPKKETICSEQISRLFSRIVQEQAKGISLKLGMYYVKFSMLPALRVIYTITEVLRLPFEIFQINIDPNSPNDAVKAAIQEEVLYRLDILKIDLQKKLENNSLTTKILENKQIELNTLGDLLLLYRDELAGGYHSLENLLNEFQKHITEATEQSKTILLHLKSSF